MPKGWYGCENGSDLANVVYCESIKQELKKRLILECRCDARLRAKVEGSARLVF